MPGDIVQGNSGNILSLTITDNGKVVDLTNATVTVTIKYNRTTGVTKQATITDPLNGKCQVTLDSSNIQNDGIYTLQGTVNFSDGRVFSSEIENLKVTKKQGFVPSIGGGTSNIGSSTINGNIIINGVQVKVYDDTPLQTRLTNDEQDIATLKAFLPLLNRLGIDSNGNLTVDGKIVGSPVNSTDTTPPVVTISPNGGTFNSTQNVTLSATDNSGGTVNIYYTLDGSTPTSSSTKYTNAISISSTTTINFIGVDSSGNTSTMQSTLFTIDTVAPTVTISPIAGTYTSTQSVTISANETSTIYYTTDGSVPTTSSSVYSSPISVASSETINYLVIDTAGNQTTGSATYTINSNTVGTATVGSTQVA